MPVGHYLVRGDAYVYFKFHSYKTFGEIKLFVTEWKTVTPKNIINKKVIPQKCQKTKIGSEWWLAIFQKNTAKPGCFFWLQG